MTKIRADINDSGPQTDDERSFWDRAFFAAWESNKDDEYGDDMGLMASIADAALRIRRERDPRWGN